jgi:hypothetical protein
MALTQEQVDEVTALMQQQDAARRAATAAAVALAVARTRGFNEWYSTAAITTWAASLVRGIEALQRALARQTDALFCRQAMVMTGRTVRPVGAVDVSTLRKGVTHAGAYGRVADTYRYQQSLVDSGKQVQAAIDAAVSRAEAVVETDTQLVVRAQAQRFMLAQPAVPLEQQPGPVLTADLAGTEPQRAPEASVSRRARLIGYRRIVHPELSRGGTCGMCIVASHRLYKRDDLLPIHGGCNCLPMPVYEGADPGSIINDADLERFYAEAGGKQAAELKRTRYQVTNNGELGPVLSRAGAKVRTVANIEEAERGSR